MLIQKYLGSQRRRARPPARFAASHLSHVVSLEREACEQWLHGTREEAAALIQLPAADCYAHGAADPSKQVALPLP